MPSIYDDEFMAGVLLAHGANVNAQDDLGYTPLHQMSRDGNMDVVRSLVKYGANILTSDNCGKNAIITAKEMRHDNVAQCLLEKIKPQQKNRSRTSYFEGFTMALHRHDSNFICPQFIVEHAQRRVDLYFYMLIAYYNTGLTAQIFKTEDQHGQGKQHCVRIKLCAPNTDDQRRVTEQKDILLIKGTSNVLMGYCDVNNQYTQVPIPNEKEFSEIIGLVWSYDQGYSLMRMQCDPKSLQIEEIRALLGRKPAYVLFKSKAYYVDINLDKTELRAVNFEQFEAIFPRDSNVRQDASDDNLIKITALTGHKRDDAIPTRLGIFKSQKKGSFQSTWHENSGNHDQTLNDDYVNMILKLTKDEINRLQKQDHETGAEFLSRFPRDSKEIYERAYAAIKVEMGLREDLVPQFMPRAHPF